MNRVWLTAGLALMEMCWIAVWSALVGGWSDPMPGRPLLSWSSVLVLLLLGALSAHALGRRAARSRATRLSVACLGLLPVLILVRQDQYPGTTGLDWLGALLGALAAAVGQLGGPALAFGLGISVWWRGIRLGTQTAGAIEVDSAFRWGTALLVGFCLIMALSTPGSRLPALEAQTTPFVVIFFFVGLVTLALGRLESLRTRTRALALNVQWLSLLVGVVGLVVVSALLIGQLLSFDVLLLATRPLLDLVGQVLLLALYVIIIPLALVVQWVIFLLLSLAHGNLTSRPPEPIQPGEVDSVLARLLSQQFPPELLLALRTLAAVALIAAAVAIVARAAARWRPSTAEADATGEERDSLWRPGGLRDLVLAWLARLFGRTAKAAGHNGLVASTSEAPAALAQLPAMRELYRQLLILGASVGAERHPAATPFEHLTSLQQALEPEDAVARITRAYVGVRYADSQSSTSDIAAARAQLAHVHPRPVPDPQPPA